MGWLIDTNVLSELRKGDRANLGVRNWFTHAEDGALFTSVLVVGEIRRGVQLTRRRDPIAAEALDQWILRLTESFADRVLPVDDAVAQTWGRLNVPDPVAAIDGLLAATALVHGLTVVTRSARDFERTRVGLANPFTL